MKRIIFHWTAGGNTPSNLDKGHYHFLIDGSGKVHRGKWPVEANDRPVKGQYAAHTLNCNTGSIGVAVCAMAGAVERPFDAGRAPIIPAQVEALATLCRDLGRQYGIPVTPQTMLSHAEVQPTLGIKQRGKWDIAWLPGMSGPADPVAVGNKLRAMIAATNVKSPPVSDIAPRPVSDAPVQNRTDQEPIKKPLSARPIAYVAGFMAAVYAVWEWGAGVIDWLTFWN
jgi:hypothetical protein